MKTLTIALILLCSLVLSAADSKWRFTATDSGGHDSQWVLELKTQDGKLTGTLANDEITLPLVDPKADDTSITFKVVVNEVTYDVELKVDGDKLEGKYSGAEANGTIKGARET
jgi:hypothetical protein